MPSEPYVATVSVFQDPPAPYTPREGDVIERGRTRYVAIRAGDEDVIFNVYHRWPLCSWGKVEASPERMLTPEFAALVNHMGWRLLPRGGEA